MKKSDKIHLSVVAIFLQCFTYSFAQMTPDPPDPRSRAEIESILSMAPRSDTKELSHLHIVLLASKKDHGLHEHDYPRWQDSWSLLLGGKNASTDSAQLNMFGPIKHSSSHETMDGAESVEVSKAWDWPSKAQFRKADLIVAFSVVHWSPERNAELRSFLARGGGFVVIHQSCVVADGTGLEDEVVDLIGLSWHWDQTRWRHGPMHLDLIDNRNAITLGLPQQIYFFDEAYWPLYGNRSKVDILATSKETNRNFAFRKGDGKIDFSNMRAIQQKWPEEPTKDEPMFWTYEFGKGRVFGSILGHYSWTFDDPYFRLLVLRGMAWAAGESMYRFDHLVLRGASVR